MAGLEVEPARVAVHLHGPARGGQGVEHLLHADGVGVALAEQPADPVPPDLEDRRRHGPHQPPGHLVLVHPHPGVDARHHDLELVQHRRGPVQRAVLQDVRLGTLEEPDPHLLLDPIDLLPLPPEAVDRQAAGVARALRVVGDGEVLHPQGLRTAGHVLHRGAAVRPERVAVDHAPHVLLPDQVGREGPVAGGLELALVLAELGRHEGEAQGPVEGLLALHRHLGGRVGGRSGLGAGGREPVEPPFAERVAQLAGQAPQPDVVRLRAGQVVEQRGEVPGWHHPQVHRQPAREPPRAPGLPPGQDLQAGIGAQPRGDRGGIAGGHRDVEVAHRLPPAPGRARELHRLHLGRGAEVREERLRQGQALGEEDAGVRGPRPGAGQPLEDPRLRPLAEALHPGDAAVPAGRLEVRQAGDAQRGVERSDLLRAEVRDLQELQEARRVPGAQLVQGVAAAGGVERGDLARQRLPDALDLGEAPLGHHRREVLGEPFQGAGAVS